MIMEIVLASRNKKKIIELQTMLSEYCGDKITVLSLDDIGYIGEIEEDGESFEENAIIKASVPASLGYIGVADDSGLTVDALNGAPGIFSARFAGEHATDEENNEKLLKSLENVADENRGAAYVCTVAVVSPKGMLCVPDTGITDALSRFSDVRSGRETDCFTVRGECRGTILREKRGEGGFGYDPMFYIPERGITFGQMAPGDKNKMSHRGKAMRAFAEIINKVVE